MANTASHIQLPKCVLKNFQDDKQWLYYYDFESNKIGRGRAKSFNTEKGYYSQEVENYLRDTIETPFGKVMSIVKEITKDDRFSIPTSCFDSVREYIYALIGRGPEMQKIIGQNSVLFQFLPSQDRHDYAVMSGIENAKERKLFENWQVTFMVNDSNIPFVLPRQGIFDFEFKSYECTCLSMPITPRISIILIPEEHISEFVDNGVTKLLSLSDDEIAKSLNNRAFLTEKKHNKQSIISNKREEIERLVNEMLCIKKNDFNTNIPK